MSDHGSFVRLTHIFNAEAYYTTYRKTFTILKAETPELLEACFKLRYQIYCAENGFKKFRHTERLEYDSFDRRAVHFLLQHNETKKYVGTVRVILPDAQNSEKNFPMQEICDHPLLHAGDRPQNFCQISRLCMHPDFRRRNDDGNLLPAYYPQEDIKGTKDGNLVFIRRSIPYAPLGLMQAAFETALRHRITDCLMFVEPEQLPHFERMGIAYSILGPQVRNNGLQQPIVFNIKQVLDSMALENRECWDVASDMGRIHKMVNDISHTDWRDHMMDDLNWEKIWKKLS